MQKRYLIMIIAALTLFASFVAYAADEKISGAHLESGLECADCHETDTPVKRANQRVCQDCHGDKTDDANVLTFKDISSGTEYKSAIHTSHAGQLRCTLCHFSHQSSKLYCNDGCHHNWDIKVP